MENIQEVKVQTKDWSNPTPAGLVALAAVCMCFFALLNGYLDTSKSGTLLVLGGWLIGGFVVQVIVGMLDLKSGNGTGGNTFLFFSAFFMLTGGLEMFFKAGGGVDARIDGYAWLVLTLALYLWTPAFCKSFSLLSLVVLAIVAALPFKTILSFGVASPTFSAI
ncbi:MAG: GPR1/FUN34/YaaH family transporter, partial [Methanomassiliicoccaceae archaeon]|nr:GPR1/FUN34/YaaH family transporter [Methanomassiliicoccaceae archaeon]